MSTASVHIYEIFGENEWNIWNIKRKQLKRENI